MSRKKRPGKEPQAMATRPSIQTRLAAVALLLLAGGAAAQDLSRDEVLSQSLAARGGAEAWAAINTLKLTGSYSTFSAGRPFVLVQQRPNNYRLEYVYGDWPITLGYDGTTAWTADQTIFSEVPWPVEVPAPLAPALAADAEFGGPLLDPAARGHQIELVGREDFEGEDVYHLAATLISGSKESWYVDAKTFLPVARVSATWELGKPYPQRTFFSDYREVAGVKLPHHLEIEFGSRFQTMEVENVEVNPDLPPNLFALAPPAGMEPLRPLAGTWKVKIASQRFPGFPPLEMEVPSTIRASYHGALLTEELSFIAYGTPRHVTRQYTYDPFHNLYRVVYFDSLTFHANVLQGTFADGRLTVTNLETGTEWQSKGQTVHNREVVYDITEEGFKVDWDVSMDGGKTWVNQIRYVYVREGE